MNEPFRITIPRPCHEDWNKMTPQQQGNFCKSCSKLVYDFSKMSDAELTDFLSKRKEEKICGRFNSSQLAPPEKLSVPIEILPKGMNSFRAFALSLFFVFGPKLFFCTTASGASVNEVKLEVKKEFNEARLEITPVYANYIVGGWAPVTPSYIFGDVAPIRYYSFEPVTVFNRDREFDFSKVDPDSLFGKTEVSSWHPGDSEARVMVTLDSKPYTYTWDFPSDTTKSVPLPATTGYVVELVTTDSTVEGQAEVVESKNENDSIPLSVIFNDLPPGDTLQWTWGELEVNDPDTLMEDLRPPCLLLPDPQHDSVPFAIKTPVETNGKDSSQVETGGGISLEKMPAGDPGLFELECYPNPTNGPLNIRYTLRTTSDLTIEIYDLRGKMLKRIVNDNGQVSGIYLVNEDLTALEDGVYFCSMRCGNDVITQKIILTK